MVIPLLRRATGQMVRSGLVGESAHLELPVKVGRKFVFTASGIPEYALMLLEHLPTPTGSTDRQPLPRGRPRRTLERQHRQDPQVLRNPIVNSKRPIDGATGCWSVSHSAIDAAFQGI